MEDPDYKAFVSQFSHDLLAGENKFDRKNLKRSEQTPLIFSCCCQICESEGKERFKKSVFKNSFKNFGQGVRGYTWLLEQLGSISQEALIKLNIPDVAVFKKGKASFFLQFQRDRSLKCITTFEKLTNQEIIKTLTNIVRNRKKEEVLYKAGKIRASIPAVEYGKETACMRFMTRGRDNDLEDVFAEDENGALKILNENEFTGLMWQRSGSNIWKTISYIQSTLKCKKGIGESFVHTYQFKENDATDLIRAGNDENEETEEAMFQEGLSIYCEFIFKKIHYLFEKYLKIIIVQIRGEFVRDDNNRIWLIHASHIIAYDAPVQESSPTQESKTAKVHQESDILLSHLAHVAKQPKNFRTERFSTLMSRECDKIIENSRILDMFKPEEPDLLSTKAFAKLRKFTPYNLEDLLDGQKAKDLLKVYTEENRHKKSHSSNVKGIEYMSKTLVVNETPKKINNPWVFTPKVKRKSRPVSSNPRRSFRYSLAL
jgi:hypothetical protein